MAFIPFTDRFLPNIPAGSASIVNAKATEIQKDKVLLEDGSAIDYEYLVLATGTKLPQPASLETKSKRDGVSYFKNHQALVNQASNITIIGGGAVGVRE
jgi:pyruvate/2-oxoglutarate dehydrogenase complex dihydrolipoamide dehydrogenase (E3) component